MQPDLALADRWRGAAPFWEKHREAIRVMFAPVTQALVEEAGIARGHTVLDIATGPGEPALGIAASVGGEGSVIGVDLVPGMVAAARRAASRSGVDRAQFLVASAGQLPFAPASFDAVVSRFGAMFFPSPPDDVRAMLRVLRPRRRLALAVWHTPETNPFFTAVSRVLDRYVPSPPQDPDAPDAFRFAPRGKLREIVAVAGTLAPSERLFEFAIEAPVSTEEFWTLRYEMSEKLRERIAVLSRDQLVEVKRHTVEALGLYSTPKGLSFPAQVLIVSGTR